VAACGHGLLVLLGVGQGDGEKEAALLAKKIGELRIFEDSDGKMNLSLQDVGGQMLVVSQFTLYADCKKGRRPSFTAAAKPEEAERLYKFFCDQVRGQGIEVQTGVFRTEMQVSLVNDGPVTIWMDTRELTIEN
jgi:D-tyrosyl-tRNA(Tyr) deacylase